MYRLKVCKKHKLTLAVVNVEIALVDMKTAQVEVEAQIQIRISRYELIPNQKA